VIEGEQIPLEQGIQRGKRLHEEEKECKVGKGSREDEEEQRL
jgi:hypothetical protein